MKLPLPEAKLADCVWLPRIIAKARAVQAGTLPPEYVARFGAVNGVDGQFLQFFGIQIAEISEIAKSPDGEIADWFRAHPKVTPARIAEWNHVAVNLGRTGFPLGERFPIALRSTYRHLADRGLITVFEVLKADEEQA